MKKFIIDAGIMSGSDPYPGFGSKPAHICYSYYNDEFNFVTHKRFLCNNNGISLGNAAQLGVLTIAWVFVNSLDYYIPAFKYDGYWYDLTFHDSINYRYAESEVTDVIWRGNLDLSAMQYGNIIIDNICVTISYSYDTSSWTCRINNNDRIYHGNVSDAFDLDSLTKYIANSAVEVDILSQRYAVLEQKVDAIDLGGLSERYSPR